MIEIPYKSTKTLIFTPQVYQNGDWVVVVPDSISGALESYDATPELLTPLTPYSSGDGTYAIDIYADDSVIPGIKIGDRYFVAFYWEYNGVKTVKRLEILIIVGD